MPQSLLRLFLLLLALLAPLPAADPSAAQSASQHLPQPIAEALNPDNPVVAYVNDVEIRWNDVVLSALELPSEYQRQVQALFPVLLGRLIDLELIAQKARAEGVASREEFKKRLRDLENKLLQEMFLRELLSESISEEEIAKRVEVMTTGDDREEVRLAMIVCATQQVCYAALDRLRAGTDFAKVARENSLHASAASGGELGWFGRAELQPAEVAAEAFRLAPGEYSRQPLDTEIGWVILKVQERRMGEPLSKLELAERIRTELARLTVDKLLVELRKSAEIRLFPY